LIIQLCVFEVFLNRTEQACICFTSTNVFFQGYFSAQQDSINISSLTLLTA